MKMLIHTPEGVRDIYNRECEEKLYLQSKIHNLLKIYGYADIQTPTFEFFDVFSKDKGSTPSKNMYKFFDREGNTLVLRPDMTPSIARAVSKYFTNEDMPIRFCYIANAFVNNAEHQGKLKEFTQIGAELIGENTVDSDVEAIVLMINSFLECGLKDFQIEIGHTGIFKGLTEGAKFDEEEIEELKELFDNKNFFGVESFVKNSKIDEAVKSKLLSVSSFTGSIDVIKSAMEIFKNKTITDALSRLEEVYEILSYYGYEKYVSFDLANVSNHEYYTGIIFKGYTYGTGDAIATGGRYDNLLKLFGKDSPSLGFAINLDRLQIAMNRQKIMINTNAVKKLIVYDEANRKTAIEKSIALRKENVHVTMIKKNAEFDNDKYKCFAAKNDMNEIIYLTGINDGRED